MRRAVLLAIGLALPFGVAPALAHQPPPSSGISGAVRNTTCPGPCREPPPQSPLYTGDGLVVKVRDLETHRLVYVLHPKDGRFEVVTSPGRYHVHAFVRPRGECWQGSAKNVRVVDDRRSHVRLTVANQCVV